jgi:hypothetical protein
MGVPDQPECRLFVRRGAVIFVMLAFVMPRSRIPIVGFVICLATAWYEISQLKANP